MAGQTNLMEFRELCDIEKLRKLFDAFNRKREILHLLDQCVHGEGIQIFIGEESGYQMLDECSMVTAPYSVDGRVLGVLGVIGPTRMAYDRVIPIVDATARLLGAALNTQRITHISSAANPVRARACSDTCEEFHEYGVTLCQRKENELEDVVVNAVDADTPDHELNWPRCWRTPAARWMKTGASACGCRQNSKTCASAPSVTWPMHTSLRWSDLPLNCCRCATVWRWVWQHPLWRTAIQHLAQGRGTHPADADHRHVEVQHP